MGCVLSCNPSNAVLTAYAPRPLMLLAFVCPGPLKRGNRLCGVHQMGAPPPRKRELVMPPVGTGRQQAVTVSHALTNGLSPPHTTVCHALTNGLSLPSTTAANRWPIPNFPQCEKKPTRFLQKGAAGTKSVEGTTSSSGSFSRSPESTQTTTSVRSTKMAEWSKALMTDRYVSPADEKLGNALSVKQKGTRVLEGRVWMLWSLSPSPGPHAQGAAPSGAFVRNRGGSVWPCRCMQPRTARTAGTAL